MTDVNLLPCPFCGAGKTEIREDRPWLGMRYGEPSSVSVRHWCAPVVGQPSRMIERVGRDRAAAIAAWNMRTTTPAVQGEPVAYISQEDFEFLLSDERSGPHGTLQAPVFSRKDYRVSVPLYASPQPPAQDASALVEALELARRTLAMAAIEGEVTSRIDSALAAYRQGGGE